MLTHLSLFTGIGGLDIAAEWAGFKTVGQCEYADYPTRVLEKHWPDVPRWRDVRTLTRGDFYERTGLKTVDIISGGFPCQPFSVAGKQKGKGDDRYLWPEMRRVITELAPRCVVGENVPGIIKIAASDVAADLESIGYQVVVLDFEAAAVGAWHRRERIAFVAYSDGERCKRYRKDWKPEPDKRCEKEAFKRGDIPYADDRSGVVRRKRKLSAIEEIGGRRDCVRAGEKKHGGGKRRPAESGLGGMADGIPNWLDGYWTEEPEGVPRLTEKSLHRQDRLKSLGNAVVPQQFYPIFKAMAEVLNDHGN